MIETKEQYLTNIALLRNGAGDSIQRLEAATGLMQTIEALRDKLKFVIRRYDIDGDALDELLDDLPDWITTNENS